MRLSLRSSARAAALCALLLIIGSYNNSPSYAQTNSRHFPETEYTVQGRFLEYWEQHGGLPQQGYPISAEMQEASPIDGKTYTVQYFERAVFELHPENQPPFDVLLSLLGTLEYQQKFLEGALGQVPNTSPGSVVFPETGKRLGGKFLEYWRTHGGLAQQGYPISDEFKAISDLDGKSYTVQYFERAVFELHPENAGTPYEVLLSQLGTFRYKARYAARSLSIPSARGGLSQTNPVGSDRYLAWIESVQLPSKPSCCGVLALDIATGRTMTVTVSRGFRGSPAISGSRVAWAQAEDLCSGDCLPSGIYVLDLATGERYKVSDTASIEGLDISGRTITWAVSTYKDGRYSSQVFANDLVTGQTSEIASLSGGRVSYLQISPSYIVWHEIAPVVGSGESRIWAHDRKSGATRPVLDYGTSGFFSGGALEGNYLVWAAKDRINVADLRDGTTKSAEATEPAYPTMVYNNVLWSTGPKYRSIMGMKLEDLKPVELVRMTLENPHPEAPDNQPMVGKFTIAGDWLVWDYRVLPPSGPGIAQLKAMPLAEAFSKGASISVP
ncbi:MAG: hypothetical protein M3328_00890 [Chloroflexota bacterium]|nr:hypothetical protein [Chloroflexota bacterium]